MHALSVSLLRAKQLPVITNGLGASPHAGSTCTIGVVAVRPLNRLPARLYFKLKPDPNNTFFFIFTCTTQYPWVLANLNLSQAMAPSKKKRTHTVFRDSSAYRSASTSKPRFVGEKVKLGDVCDVLNGFAFKSRQYVDKGIRIIRIANVQKGYLEDSKPCFYPVKLTDSLKQYILEENDLLVSLTGNVGRVALLEKSFLPAALNQRVACLRIKDESRICKRYLYHALNSSLFENNCVESANGIAQKNMSTTWLKGYRIPAPSMVEQEIIIKQLDLIQRQISNVKRQLSEFDSLVKSRFIEIFGNPIRNEKGLPFATVEELAAHSKHSMKAGPFGSSLKKSCYVEAGYKIYGQEQVISGDENYGDYYIDSDKYQELCSCHVEPGDVLISLVGTVGKVLVLSQNCQEGIINPRLVKITFDRLKMEPDFFSVLFTLESVRDTLLDGAHGQTMSVLNLGMIKKLRVAVPPIEQQRDYLAFVQQVDKSGFATHCDHLRASY